MFRFILNRFALMIPVLFGVSIVTFALIRFVPGDPVTALIGPDTRFTEEQLQQVRHEYGLDQPLPVQYAKWIGKILQGDLGESLRTRRPLVTELQLRLPVTLELTIWAAVIGTLPALAVGVLAAIKRNTWIDYGATVLTPLGTSVPNFLLAVLLVLLFAVQLGWLPPLGYVEFSNDPLQHMKNMVLPSLSLGLPLAAVLMRITRSSVLEVIGQEHVRTARAKGLPERSVLRHHVVRNASIPILTVAGIQIAQLIGGTVIIEQIFGLPGVGRYIYEAIANRDYPVVQGVTLVIATLFVLVSLAVDVLYAMVDPRLRHT
jgi:peptide/nickel transport system permease protein